MSERRIDWNAEQVEALRQALGEGMSSAEAAAHLSAMFDAEVTRLAVIGKARRENIVIGPKSGGRPPRAIAQCPCNKPTPVAAPGSHPVTLFHLRAMTCRWPLWNYDGTGERLYCGAVAPIDKPYCAHHARVASAGKANLFKPEQRAEFERSRRIQMARIGL